MTGTTIARTLIALVISGGIVAGGYFVGSKSNGNTPWPLTAEGKYAGELPAVTPAGTTSSSAKAVTETETAALPTIKGQDFVKIPPLGPKPESTAPAEPKPGIVPPKTELMPVKPAPEPTKPEPAKPEPTKPTPDTTLTVKPAAPKPAVAPAAAKFVSGPDDHTMFGGTPGRNMLNPKAKNVVAKPDPEGGENLLWKANLGSRAYGGPTIANGRVVVGTNNERPRNPRDSKKNSDGIDEPLDKGIIMCFDEKTGEFLWQSVHDKLPSGPVNDWPKEGICSTSTILDGKVYYISNRCTVVCADLNGMADGNQGFTGETYTDKTDVDIIWEHDLMKLENVFPHNMAAGCPLIVGDLVYLVTANGVDEGHLNIPSPNAASFVALNKDTGKMVWKDAAPGNNIMHGQWSNPAYAEIKGVKQVIFPGGDGWLYSYEPLTGAMLWKFDCNPKAAKYELGGTGTRNDFIGTPVIYQDKVFIGVGQDPEHFTGIGHFWCIDPSVASKTNMDISPKDDNYDPANPKNKGTGLVWHYGGADTRKFVPRDFVFGRTMSTATIVDDVIYIAELQGFLHCIDAKTGKRYWQFDLKGAIWGSSYFVDGKVMLATEGGELFVFKHTKTPKVIDELDVPDAKDNKDFNTKMKAKRKEVEAEYLLSKIEFDAPIRSTPIVANGVLFVMSESTLYAFGAKKE